MPETIPDHFRSRAHRYSQRISAGSGTQGARHQLAPDRLSDRTGRRPDPPVPAHSRPARRATDASPGPPQKCEIFAVGDVVVSSRAHPPTAAATVGGAQSDRSKGRSPRRMCRWSTRLRAQRIERNSMCRVARPRRLHCRRAEISPFFVNQSSIDEAVRRALEFCGINAGVPCAIIAVDNVFVVAGSDDDESCRLLSASDRAAYRRGTTRRNRATACRKRGGLERRRRRRWRQCGLSVKADTEADAISGAIADCQQPRPELPRHRDRYVRRRAELAGAMFARCANSSTTRS